MHEPSLSFLACVCLLTTASAQDRFGDVQTVPRVATRLAFWTRDRTQALGQVCVEYSQPAWKDEYEQTIAQAKGTRVRLGGDFWTTLDTNATMSVGDRIVPHGQWYLGLSCSEKEEWSLAVFSPERVRDVKGDARDTPSLKPVIEIPLRHGRSEDSVAKLTIQIERSEQAVGEGRLVIAWGKHTLSAPFVLNLARPGPPRPSKIDLEAKAKAEIKMIDDAVKTFFVMNGKVPRMQELTAPDRSGMAFLEGFRGRQPTDPWGSAYEIKEGETRGSWEVVSYGPDKKPGTADDLSSHALGK